MKEWEKEETYEGRKTNFLTSFLERRKKIVTKSNKEKKEKKEEKEKQGKRGIK